MPSSDKERDFEDVGSQRFPGRFDPRLLNLISNAGDGYPGLQQATRNWIKYWLHDGVMDQALDLNSQDINNVNDLDVNGDIDCEGDVDINNNEIKNVDIINDNIYYVTTTAETQAAIDDIGAGYGRIIIMESFTITVAIDVDGGGSYIIEGVSNDVTLTTSGNIKAFNVTSATSCIIRQLKLDYSSYSATTTECITVDETSDNKVIIDNIFASGDGTNGTPVYFKSNNCVLKNSEISSGYRIYIVADNCIATNCRIDDMDIATYTSGDHNEINNLYITNVRTYGIYFNASDFIYIINNTIVDLNISGAFSTICVNNVDNSIIKGNIIKDVYASSTCRGIYIHDSTGCIIDNNILYNIRGAGSSEIISVSQNSHENIVNNNIIKSSQSNTAGTLRGIYIQSDRCVVNSNNIYAITNLGAGGGIGIYISSTADNTTVVGNTSLSCKTNFTDSGTNTLDANNNIA